jgi:acyl carrier protein
MPVLDRLRDLAAKELSIDSSALELQTPLTALHIDSLAFIDFLFKVEQEFGIRVPDQRMNSIRTIGDLEQLVSELLTTPSET